MMEERAVSPPSDDIQKHEIRPRLWLTFHGQMRWTQGFADDQGALGDRAPEAGCMRVLLRTFAILLLLCLALPAARGAQFDGFAFVNDDGTLRVRNRTIHLYGILIPPTEETCYFFERPAPCGPRTALALKFNIGTDFVHCKTRSRNADGSYVAVCTAGDEDLAAELLLQGWAVALPDAPFEYQALEKIARSRGIGVWGLAVQRGTRSFRE
jgi:endonuclease YncB( thermonuclease family)